MTLVLVFLVIYLRIVYITYEKINKIFTSLVLFFYQTVGILENSHEPIIMLYADGKAVLP